MREVLRYWHTLRHLRPVQFYGRLWHRFHQPRLDLGANLPLRPLAGTWAVPIAKRVSMEGANSLRFLNCTHLLPDRGGWNEPSLEKLWLYNLHYFDDLNAADASRRLDWHSGLMRRWVDENPPTSGNGWEPYPTSLRVVNWVKWALAGNTLPGDCRGSLAQQARWLSRRLEWHLLGNHLFANAKALVFAGLYFQGMEAESWLETGLDIIAKELPEQVLADGGNFERSTMYHAIFLEDVLDLINAATAWAGCVDNLLVEYWKTVAGQMLDWLAGMTHPDGEIAFFNDAAIGIAAEPASLSSYAAKLGIHVPAAQASSGPLGQDLRMHHWPDSGYVRLEAPDAVALLDVAPVGPDYLPGHAHADTLSFELSVFGERVIVNGGTSCYGNGPERLRERQTLSHSTVEVAGESSSEVWGGFRVARRAYPLAIQTNQEPGMLSVRCSHNGYARLRGRPVHRREWVMAQSGLSVTDVVTSRIEHPAVARYILHPSVVVSRVDSQGWHLHLPSGREMRLDVTNGVAKIDVARFAPEFGKVLPTRCLAVELVGGKANIRISWR